MCRTDRSNSEQAIEVYRTDAWLPLCASGVDKADGDVICRQLGYGYVPV